MSASIAVFRRSKQVVADSLETFLVAPALVRRVDDNWSTVVLAQPRGTQEVAAHLSELLQTGTLWLTFSKNNFAYLLFENGVERDRFDMVPYPAYSVFIDYDDWETPPTPEQIHEIERSQGDPSALLPYCVNDPNVTEADLRYALNLMRQQHQFSSGEDMQILETFGLYFAPVNSLAIPLLLDSYPHFDSLRPPNPERESLVIDSLRDPEPIRAGHSRVAQWYKDWELGEVAAIPWAIDRVRELLADGANPNAVENEHVPSAVFKAAIESNADALRLLLAAGGNPNTRGRLGVALNATALMATIRRAQFGISFFEAMQVLLENGAEINARDENGQTALGHLLSYFSPKATWRANFARRSNEHKQRFAGTPQANYFDDRAIQRETELQRIVSFLQEHGAIE